MGQKKGCCCACCTPVVTITLLLIFGIIFACLGAASIPLFKDLYENTVKKQLVMKKGNEAYNNWYNPPAPVYMQYYIFNYTNYNDVVNKNEKPNVTQHGPYTYREARINTILEYNEYDITYLQNYSYIFDVDASCTNCSEDDYMYTPNTPILTVAKKIHDLGVTEKSGTLKQWEIEALNKALQTVFSKEWTLFKHLTVKELLWGYNEKLFEDFDKFRDILANVGLHLPILDPLIALQHNGTDGALAIGNLTISTGKENIDNVQTITKWRGADNAPFWLTKYGEMLNGTDGSHYKPFTKREDKLYVFTSELCRSLYLEYLTDRKVMDIALYRFHTTANLFANHTVNPDNFAFCSNSSSEVTCWGTGVLPVGQCQEGNPPVFMSAPHFYQGDSSFTDAINGIHPVEDLHATFLDVEPTTGIVMEAHKRLQVNMLVQRDDFITILQHFSQDDTFLPVMWVHEMAKIDKKSADKFKSEVLGPKKMLKGIEYGLMAFGGFLVLLALIVGVVHKSRKNTYTEMENDSDPKNQHLISRPDINIKCGGEICEHKFKKNYVGIFCLLSS